MNQQSAETRWDFDDLQTLVVDDQQDVCRGLARLIGQTGCRTETASSGEEALRKLRQDHFDIVFTDIMMEGISGEQLLHEIKRLWPDIEVVMITGHGSIEMAVSCLQSGASHFISKPFNNQEILAYYKQSGYRILSRRSLENGPSRDLSQRIVAVDPRMREVLSLVDQVAPRNVPVLIEGASGTGKELIAREIHHRSPWREHPFLAINCIALPDTLLESELFGYKRGAFTGAHRDTKGLFEQAAGGTVFLDEVASMSLSFQGKLLRVLQEKVIRPLGASADVPVQYRLIASTNCDLEAAVRHREFREDLFYRLQVVKIRLPSLNDRPDSIPALTAYFLKRAVSELAMNGEPAPEISPAAMDRLMAHEWRGNVRELENTIYRAVVMCRGDKILPSHLGFSDDAATGYELAVAGLTYEEGKQKAVESFQRHFVEIALKRTGGNISKAALLSGLTRAAFQRIMRRLETER